jgi:hypothetical protein
MRIHALAGSLAVVLLLLVRPALAGTHCMTDEEQTLERWESTITPPPGQTCVGQLHSKTRPWEGRCR